MGMKWVMAAALAVLSAGDAVAETYRRGEFAFEVLPEPAFVARARLADSWPADAPGADEPRWRFWLYDRQIDRRGADEADYVDYAYQARTPSLVGEAGRYSIVFNPAFQRLVLHRVEVRRDGRWTNRLNPERVSLARREGEFERDIATGDVTALILIDDVAVDDVVRIAYTVHGSNPVMGGQGTDWFTVGYQSPALDVAFRTLHPAGTRLRTRTEHTPLAPTVRTTAEGVEAVLRTRGIGPVVEYGDHPRWHTGTPLVQVGVEREWRDVVDWALPLYPAWDGALPQDLEARVAQWRALPDPAARLSAALRAVQDDVRYFGIEMGDTTHRPHAPPEVWTRRFGDCKDKAYLLVTLLRRLDIAAVPALVSASGGRAVGRSLPSADAFDHVIVRAELDGAPVWVDPTLSLQGGDPRRTDLSEYGLALPIRPGAGALDAVPRPDGASAGIDIAETFALARHGDPIDFTVRTTYVGATADTMRLSLRDARAEDLQRRYAEFYTKRYGPLDVVAPPKVRDDRAANRLEVAEHYRLRDGLDDEGGGVRALELYPDALGDVSALPDYLSHPGPLYVGPVGTWRHRVDVRMPGDWSARFAGERVAHRSDAIDYARVLDVEAGRATLDFKLDIRASSLEGAAVRAHLEELRALRDTYSVALRYQLPASLKSDERERRLKQLLRDVLTEDASAP